MADAADFRARALNLVEIVMGECAFQASSVSGEEPPGTPGDGVLHTCGRKLPQ